MTQSTEISWLMLNPSLLMKELVSFPFDSDRFEIIPKLKLYISAHESETSEWAERIDSLNAEKSRLASENAQLLADKDGLLLKLSELESEMARINARLDNVVEESATKTDNYIEQIKENRSKFYFHQKWTFQGCISEKPVSYRFSLRCPCIFRPVVFTSAKSLNCSGYCIYFYRRTKTKERVLLRTFGFSESVRLQIT